MTTREILDAALQRGLLHPTGKTPEASLSARLYTFVRTPGADIVRVYEPGFQRARRGSVRWALRNTDT